MEYRNLPFDVKLEVLRKEARVLLHALGQDDVAAVAKYRPFDALEEASRARVADAQYLVRAATASRVGPV